MVFKREGGANWILLGEEEEEEEDCYFRKGVAVVSGKERCAESRFYPKMRRLTFGLVRGDDGM